MIKFALKCKDDHVFEAWFSNGADFDRQKDAGYISCPHCGSPEVAKNLMAPSVSTGNARAVAPETPMELAAGPVPAEVVRALKEAVTAIRKNCEDVGERFAEEVRKVHYGEAEARGLMGKASADDVGSLLDEGIEIMPLPTLPEDAN